MCCRYSGKLDFTDYNLRGDTAPPEYGDFAVFRFAVIIPRDRAIFLESVLLHEGTRKSSSPGQKPRYHGHIAVDAQATPVFEPSIPPPGATALFSRLLGLINLFLA
ncbi:hypothetical protein ANO14919_066740 [Xylariales sp. No.14919]|nr:hypothetical protein ANO14919_066740 [Xylariales sp. No.14919]